MKSVYALNDLYPFSNGTVTTSGETIPEDVERQHYQDNTVDRADGKTEVIDPKMIFLAIGGFIALAVFLNHLE